VPIRPALARVIAGLAALTLAVGAFSFVRAVVLTQGWIYSGFVSETGEPGAQYRDGYTYGTLGLGAALLLLALAIVLRRGLLGGGSAAWLAWSAAGLLSLGGLLAGVSSLVSCSAGCPLPPFETPTAGDLVHASSSVLGMAVCGATMAVFAIAPTPSPLRTVSRLWVGITLPLAIVAGVSLVFVGRGVATGSIEKVLVLVIIAWVLTTSLIISLVRADD
jgi:Protein of unknown function (DUF998)